MDKKKKDEEKEKEKSIRWKRRRGRR